MNKNEWPFNILEFFVRADDWPMRWRQGIFSDTDQQNLTTIISSSLDKDQQYFVYAYFKEGKSHDEICRELGISRGKLQNIVSNTKKHLQTKGNIVRNSIDYERVAAIQYSTRKYQEEIDSLKMNVEMLQEEIVARRNQLAKLNGEAIILKGKVDDYHEDPLKTISSLDTIYDIGLSEKTIHGLQRNRINTVDELIEKLGQYGDHFKVRCFGIGDNAYDEILACLSDHGYL